LEAIGGLPLLFRNIMLPLELAHADEYEKALTVACDLARQYNSPVTIVGLSALDPDGDALEPAAHAHELDRFAAEQMARHGVSMTTRVMPNGNRSLSEMLDEQIWSVGADLVLIASAFADQVNRTASRFCTQRP
jgi:nucleotide-binding universal stress UspA family protein